MSVIEKEIKVLDIDVEKVKNKLEELGGTIKEEGIQKIYVYDLPSIYLRFNDCKIQLKKSLRSYEINIVKNRLNVLFIEIDNMITREQQDIILNAVGYKFFKDILLIKDIEEFKRVLFNEKIENIVKQLNINPNKWIRIRETNGKTTITVKHILSEEMKRKYNTSMQPVMETEMEVPSIESANCLLEQLNFSYRNYQEKKRITYILDNTEIDIDIWPLIPPYMEIEGKTDKQIYEIIKKIGIMDKELISCNTAEVYKKYGIDIYQYRELRFNQKDENVG